MDAISQGTKQLCKVNKDADDVDDDDGDDERYDRLRAMSSSIMQRQPNDEGPCELWKQ